MDTAQPLNDKLHQFVDQMTRLLDQVQENEEQLLSQGAEYLKVLVAVDDWLPSDCAIPHPEFYQQYLLYRDPEDRFSVVSFVWGPDQQTPIHDHTVWGLIGMLRGSEVEQQYHYEEERLVAGKVSQLTPGDIAFLSPTLGDIHQVRNAHADQVSISIHVYGADIGKVSRHVMDPLTSRKREFISGYANAPIPSIDSSRT